MKINVVDRLSRHMAEGVPSRTMWNYLKTIRLWAPTEPVIHIDDSDIIKQEGYHFEALGVIRLYEKEEYSACIVSAFSKLETLLQTHMPPFTHNRNEIYKTMYMYYLYAIPNNTYDSTVKDCLSLRNKVVHASYSATKLDAENVLHFVETVYKQFLSHIADDSMDDT